MSKLVKQETKVLNELENVQTNQTIKDILVEDLSSTQAIEDFARGIIPESFAKDYKKLKKLQDQVDKIEKEIKEKLIEMWEQNPDAEKSVSMDGLKFTYTKSFERTTVDGKKLQEEYPDIYKKMLKTSNVKASVKTYVEF